MMTDILYDARDPATHKVVLDRGMRSGVTLGLPVIDNLGVVGQVTRVFPFTSEVTLLTDKEQAIPVQVLRSGLRSVAYGRGQGGVLDLRFVAPNADIQVGDVLVTSGLDGMYPAGLAVAKVIQVENVGQGAFGRVVCQPLAGIDRNRQLLIVMSREAKPPRPPSEAAKTIATSKKNLPTMGEIPLPPLPATPLPAQQPAQAGQGAAAAPVQGAAGPAPGAAAVQAPAAGTPPAGQPGALQHPAPAPAGAAPRAAAPAGAMPAAAPANAPAQQRITPAPAKPGTGAQHGAAAGTTGTAGALQHGAVPAAAPAAAAQRAAAPANAATGQAPAGAMPAVQHKEGL
jgi:rod shape-determining protein MreC